MYGYRQANDIDYLHKDNNKLSLDKIGVHDGKWLTYYHLEKILSYTTQNITFI